MTSTVGERERVFGASLVEIIQLIEAIDRK